MYKNQLQELAQRSCFNLPSYTCIREGPDHAPRFKATVNFNGETFESPIFCSTLRQAEHAAAEVALNVLSEKGPSKALAARVLDETGVYKNLLQETAHRAGLRLPVYTTIQKGAGHFPVYSSNVELAGLSFMGESAKTKKQSQKNTAMAAWYALKQMSRSGSSPSLLESGGNDDKDKITVARFLSGLLPSKMSRLSHEDQINKWWETSFRKRDVIPYPSDRVQYTIQDHSQYSPEFAIYKMWAQEKSLHHPNHLLVLPFQQTSHLSLQHFPSYETVFQPNLGQCFRTAEREPFHFIAGVGPIFYVSNPLVPVPVSNASQVNIQEIEVSHQVKKNWFHANESSSHLGSVFPLDSSKLSQTQAPELPISLMQSVVQGKEEPLLESSCSAKNGIHLETKPTLQLNCDTQAITNAKFGAAETGTSEIYNMPRILHRPDHLKHSRRTQYYNRVCATAGVQDPRASIGNPPKPDGSCRLVGFPANSGRPWLQSIHAANNMAPPVHIRTVVPVCSAPSPRRMAAPHNNLK